METTKKELTKLIEEYIKSTDYTYEYAQKFYEIIPLATIDQLWRLYTFILQERDFVILSCIPNDHLAISHANMYIGIEPDGYAHS